MWTDACTSDSPLHMRWDTKLRQPHSTKPSSAQWTSSHLEAVCSVPMLVQRNHIGTASRHSRLSNEFHYEETPTRDPTVRPKSLSSWQISPEHVVSIYSNTAIKIFIFALGTASFCLVLMLWPLSEAREAMVSTAGHNAYHLTLCWSSCRSQPVS